MAKASGRTSRIPRQRVARVTTVPDIVAEFGRTLSEKLNRGGDPEDQLRAPVEALLRQMGTQLGLDAIPYGEVRLKELRARPDYAVDIGRARVGYVEIKAPNRGIPPKWKPTAREKTQWSKLSSLPNVIYTDGISWGRFQYGEPKSPTVRLSGSLDDSGNPLIPVDHTFEQMINDFLLWEPESPRSLTELIRVVAGLCRLLRDEVASILSEPSEHAAYEDLSLLADDWRDMLFPDLADDRFSDAYAQTVTFAMLLARVDGIPFEGNSIQTIARMLTKKHSLMGRAFGILTHGEAADELRVIETLRRVIGAVDWAVLDDGKTNVYVELYERFLDAYDPELRKQSGSYYTPQDVAAFMIDFVDQILRDRLKRSWGFASNDVVVVDPAMGTGTFLVEIIRSVADTVDRRRGKGARSEHLRTLFQRRLVGFEIQAAPYAVAELRLHQALSNRFDTEIPETDVRFLTDALDNPRAQQAKLRAAYRIIERSRAEANKIKRDIPVMVVIGNPPHVDHTKGLAPWIDERRTPGLDTLLQRPSMDEFRGAGLGRWESDLHALPWYFWRWATWKVFDAHPGQSAGVVAFISPSSFLKGKPYSGMREYLRRVCDEGWIVNMSPEGTRPDQATRIFGADVGRELCIAIFARYGDTTSANPAVVHQLVLSGDRETKLGQLRQLKFNSNAWATCERDWQAPFLPSAGADWESFPPLYDLMPWTSRGVTTGRNWCWAPDQATLRRRWNEFVAAPCDSRADLFVESRDRKVDSVVPPLPGFLEPKTTMAEEKGRMPTPVQAAFRSFDRQWLLADSRLMVVARPPLWTVRPAPNQLFATEQSNEAIKGGPALTFTKLIPDINHYNARSGRVFALYRDARGMVPNVAPRLLDIFSHELHCTITPEDFIAYLAALIAHGGYTSRFAKELEVPGVRVPLTRSLPLWRQAVALGSTVLKVHTFGTWSSGVLPGNASDFAELVDLSDFRVGGYVPSRAGTSPETFRYDADTETLFIGEGDIRPVSPSVWNYNVSGMRVVSHWLDYRLKRPKYKKRTSELDELDCKTWTPEVTEELLEVLTAVYHCVALEEPQTHLLGQVCGGELIDTGLLRSRGVLPVPKAATKPPRFEDPDLLTLL